MSNLDTDWYEGITGKLKCLIHINTYGKRELANPGGEWRVTCVHHLGNLTFLSLRNCYAQEAKARSLLKFCAKVMNPQHWQSNQLLCCMCDKKRRKGQIM
eukprot:285466-Pelagomonas_calceolata.AAC.3